MIARLALAPILLGATLTTVSAAEPQVERQELMKKVGGATGVVSRMARGQIDFDAAAANAAFATMNEVAAVYGELFPVGSETGFETEAKPEIWTNMEDFMAKVAKFETDTAAAAAMDFADAAAVGAALGTVGANCSACHEAYRVKN